jgi:hypothetical protein
MLESWNDGFKETRIQTAYGLIDFLVLMPYFSRKSENRCLASIIIKSRFNISCRIACFRFSCPIFHHSTIPLFPMAHQKMAVKNTMIPINCKKTDT